MDGSLLQPGSALLGQRLDSRHLIVELFGYTPAVVGHASAASGRRRQLQRSQRRRDAALSTAPAAPATELRTDLSLLNTALQPSCLVRQTCDPGADQGAEGVLRLREKRIPAYLHIVEGRLPKQASSQHR